MVRRQPGDGLLLLRGRELAAGQDDLLPADDDVLLCDRCLLAPLLRPSVKRRHLAQDLGGLGPSVAGLAHRGAHSSEDASPLVKAAAHPKPAATV